MQIENSNFGDKVSLRLKHLPVGEEINVLDVYSGRARIWKKIERISGVAINLTRMDIRLDTDDPIMLVGDNLKFLGNMDLSEYNVLDFDAFGVPNKTLSIMFERKIKTGKAIVFFTFIASQMGRLPDDLLERLGYSIEMIKHCPTLFCRDGFEKFKMFLASYGVGSIFYIRRGRKYYGGFYW